MHACAWSNITIVLAKSVLKHVNCVSLLNDDTNFWIEQHFDSSQKVGQIIRVIKAPIIDSFSVFVPLEHQQMWHDRSIMEP